MGVNIQILCRRLKDKSYTTYVFLILSFLAIFSFYPILSGEFYTLSDDNWMLLSNDNVERYSVEKIFEVFGTFYFGQYSPINTVYYIGIYAMWGYDAFWFHFFSLTTHVINSFLTFSFILKLLNLIEQKHNTKTISDNRTVALAVAMLFAIHPIQTEAIAWISASKVLLFTTFFLTSIINYVNYRNSRKSKHLILCFLSFLLSICCKEQAILLPVCLIVIDYCFYPKVSILKSIISKWAFLLTAITVGILYILLQNGGDYGELYFDVSYYPLHQRMAFAGYAITMYTFKLLIPYSLKVFYPFPNQSGEPLPLIFYFYITSLVAYSILLIKTGLMRKNPVLFFSASFFIINISLTLHIFPMIRPSVIAMRYTYISNIGFYLFLIYLLYPLWQKYRSKFKLKYLISVYIIYLLIYSNNISQNWTIPATTLYKKY